MFPAVKAGRKQTVIVNPEKPQDCAIMFRYDWAGGIIIRWENCTLWALAGLISLVLIFKAVSTKNIIVPDKLKNYMRTISAERFCQALNLERPCPLPDSVTLCRPMEYPHEFRYGIIRSGGSLGSKFILSILFLAAVTMSFYVTICWIATVVIGWVMYKFCTVRMMVFDFQEKKIFCCKSFDPEKTAKLKSLPFADIDHLKCHVGLIGRGRKYVVLCAVRSNGMMVPLCKVSESRLGLLLDLLPELAEKMGHLPPELMASVDRALFISFGLAAREKDQKPPQEGPDGQAVAASTV